MSQPHKRDYPDMTGVLFESQKDREDDRDMHGSITINGTEYWLSGYYKTSSRDPTQKFIKLTARAKAASQSIIAAGTRQMRQAVEQAAPTEKTAQEAAQAQEDDIPF